MEDSEPGIAAARAAGCTTIAVPAGMTAGLAFTDADHVVRSVAELDLAAVAEIHRRARDGGTPRLPG